MDVRFCKEQEPPPRGTRCELRVLRVLVLRAPHRRALGELFFLLTNDLHGCRPFVHWSDPDEQHLRCSLMAPWPPDARPPRRMKMGLRMSKDRNRNGGETPNINLIRPTTTNL